MKYLLMGLVALFAQATFAQTDDPLANLVWP
jgi:hypothetical protein